MMKFWISLALAVFFLQTAFSQTTERQIAVTARYSISKKAKHHRYRLQVFLSENFFTISAINLNRIPRSLKSIRFDDGFERINHSTIQQAAEESIDTTYSLLRQRQALLSFKIPAQSDFLKQKEFFLSGKRSTAFFANQWVSIAKIEEAPLKNLYFKTRGFLRTHHQYRVDLLPAATAWEFPAIDPWNCEPAELRFFQLRKLQGYGVGKIRYTPYETVKRLNIRRSFDVYFKHNEILPDQPGLLAVTDYLDKNEFEILKAELEGGCSIEGTLERNLFLQRERAKVLQKALRKYSNRKVKKDTVLMVDVFKQFRELIDKTPHRWLTKLSNDSILHLVNDQDSIRTALEPIFEIQRKASLRLVVAKRLTNDEQYNKLILEMNRVSSLLHTKSASPETEARLMGMIERLFEYYEDNFITKEECDDALSGYLKILTGYHLLRMYEDQTWPKEKVKSWEEYWNTYQVAKWLTEAQQEIIYQLELNQHRESRLKYLRMLTDFQAYNYEFIDKGLADINTLCNFIYPDKPMYMGLILNQYAFMYEMVSRKNIVVSCIPSSQCVRTEPLKKDSSINIDAFIESVKKENEVKNYELIGDRLARAKNFDMTQKGAYYFLLKQNYLKNNANALQHVEYVDGGGNVVFDVFNLWHLISINIKRWDPFENHFYDPDVQLEEMEKLVALLKKMDQTICKPQVNGLYLEYHLKMLYYLQLYPEPGNSKHAKFAESSLKYIANYYKSRSKNISPRLSLHIVKQLNDFNWLPGPNAGAWYGYEILNAVANARLLNDEEMKLYAHYLKLYNPQMKKVPTIGFEKEKLMQLWEEVY